MHRYIFPILWIVLLGGCTDDSLPPVEKTYVRPAKLFHVTGRSESDVREFAGRVAAAEVSALSFRIAGEIVEIAVRDGQQVKQGQIIARIDANDAQNDLKYAQAQFDLAVSEHERMQTLLDRRIIARAQYDQAHANFISARAALDKSRDNVAYTVLRAPFTGVIGRVSVDNHEVIQAKQLIAKVQGEKVVEITIQMPESIVANVRPENEIDHYRPIASFASMPDKTYEVAFKQNSAEANSGSQTYDVTFTLDRPSELQLLPGMSATVRIDVARITRILRSDRFVIPYSALSRADGSEKTFVWKVLPGSLTVARTAVELGRVVDQGVEVLDGVAVGDVLVSAGLSELVDGMTVRPLERERGL